MLRVIYCCLLVFSFWGCKGGDPNLVALEKLTNESESPPKRTPDSQEEGGIETRAPDTNQDSFESNHTYARLTLHSDNHQILDSNNQPVGKVALRLLDSSHSFIRHQQNKNQK